MRVVAPVSSTPAKDGGRPSPGRRERRRAETRELIFRAALGLFAGRGFAGTTVEDITEAADVGKGTFFNYFPSKEHVLAAFGEMQMDKAQAELQGVLAGREALRPALRRLVQKIAEEPGRSACLARSLISSFLISGEVRKLMSARLAYGRSFLSRAVAAGQQRGEIRADREASVIARHILEVYFGTVLLWTLFPDDPLASRLDQSYELLWASIAAPALQRRERTI